LTKILLVRHGHVEGIEPVRFRGRTELPLTKRGEAQAQALARRIAASWRPVNVYTSPMQRCIATGTAIATGCGVSAEAIDQFNDLDYGTWQWRSYDEVREADPQLFATWFTAPHLLRFPSGESLQDLVARTSNALRFVMHEHRNETVVLVGHDSVNRALLLQLLDQPLSAYWRLAQDPCCLNEVDVRDGRINVLRINETGHLAGVRD